MTSRIRRTPQKGNYNCLIDSPTLSLTLRLLGKTLTCASNFFINCGKIVYLMVRINVVDCAKFLCVIEREVRIGWEGQICSWFM